MTNRGSGKERKRKPRKRKRLMERVTHVKSLKLYQEKRY